MEKVKKDLNSLIVLSASMLWKHHNDCVCVFGDCVYVFNGSNLSIQLVIRNVLEAHLWRLAGTKGLSHLEVVAK